MYMYVEQDRREYTALWEAVLLYPQPAPLSMELYKETSVSKEQLDKFGQMDVIRHLVQLLMGQSTVQSIIGSSKVYEMLWGIK